MIDTTKERKQQMKIEAGKYYKDAHGRKVGPMYRWWSGRMWHYTESEGVFQDDGSSFAGHDPDLIEEWLNEPRPFGEIAPTRVTGTCEIGPDGKPDFTTWEETT